MQQARVQLPAVVLQIEASKVLADPELISLVGQALQGGCNMVVLRDSTSNAAAMYDAALRVQEVLRGRAALVLVDRTDIALAINAQGVLLTDQGVPTVVARRMMSGGSSLVGRVVSSEAAAVTAAADGANLVLIEGPDGSAPSPEVLSGAKAKQISGNAIPVILSVRQGTSPASGSGSDPRVTAALGADVDGVAVSPESLQGVARCCFDLPETAGPQDFATAILTRLNVKAATTGGATSSTSTSSTPKKRDSSSPSPSSASASTSTSTSSSTTTTTATSRSKSPRAAAPAAAAPAAAVPAAAPATVPVRGPAVSAERPLRRLLDPERESLLAEEKAALADILGFLEETLPGTGELSLLRDALKALDDPFLVVVVGEFNSGKSSVINALLGRRYLAEGILPTTNEISILKYAADAPVGPTAGKDASGSSGSQRVQLQQQADGLYVQYLPAKLLQDLNIVDTPGTNVILERQQRLTEEYVPRADLVLFIMSADRPFTESEVRFLEYIRQWEKKVVFVVNKSDILQGREEVDAVKQFVSANAQRILRLDRPAVIAVSSRSALRAKLKVSGLANGSDSSDPSEPPAAPLPPLPPSASATSSADLAASDDTLAASPDWRMSNFAELERHVSNFLVGKGEGGGEGVRLKLQTPLSIADALLGAAGRQLAADLQAARSELEGVQLVGRQLARFKAEMDKDAAAQRAALQPVLNEVVSRAERFVDNTVQLSNAPLLLSIAAGNKEYPFRATFEKEVVGTGFDALRTAVQEHSGWLAANCANQVTYYRTFAASRAAAAGVSVPALPPAVSLSGSDDEADRSPAPSSPSAALRAVSDFNVRAISTLLDSELQQAMATTAGTAVGAPLVGLFAMQVVQNTLEDLLLAGLSGVVSYVSLLNLPLRRADLKAKISRVATNFVTDVQSKMTTEVEEAVAKTGADVAALMAPVEAAYAEEVARLEGRQRELQAYVEELESLKRRTANLD